MTNVAVVFDKVATLATASVASWRVSAPACWPIDRVVGASASSGAVCGSIGAPNGFASASLKIRWPALQKRLHALAEVGCVGQRRLTLGLKGLHCRKRA